MGPIGVGALIQRCRVGWSFGDIHRDRLNALVLSYRRIRSSERYVAVRMRSQVHGKGADNIVNHPGLGVVPDF